MFFIHHLTTARHSLYNIYARTDDHCPITKRNISINIMLNEDLLYSAAHHSDVCRQTHTHTHSKQIVCCVINDRNTYSQCLLRTLQQKRVRIHIVPEGFVLAKCGWFCADVCFLITCWRPELTYFGCWYFCSRTSLVSSLICGQDEGANLSTDQTNHSIRQR